MYLKCITLTLSELTMRISNKKIPSLAFDACGLASGDKSDLVCL